MPIFPLQDAAFEGFSVVAGIIGVEHFRQFTGLVESLS